MEIETILKIREMKKDGHRAVDIAKALNVDYSAIKRYADKSYDQVLIRRQIRQKTEEEFEQLVIEVTPKANSINHICSKLGLRGTDGYYQKIKRIIEAHNLDTSHFGTIKRKATDAYNSIIDEEFFIKGRKRSGISLKKRLIQHGYKEYKCENPQCGLSEWHGKPLMLQVHHINGDHCDNRLENLQLLCPNCHSQTENYCGSGKKNNHNQFLVTERVNNILNGVKNEAFKIVEDTPKILSPRKKKAKTCKNCGKKFIPKIQKQKFCCHKCTEEYRQKNISEEDILQAFEKSKSFLGASKLLNVSDTGLKKIARRMGLLEEINKLCKRQVKI